MDKKNCPYLGLQKDPGTALNYPSTGNYCHHAQPVSPITPTHQNQYCLTVQHVSCPVYKNVQPKPIPSALAAPTIVKTNNPYLVFVFLLSIILLAGYLLLSTGDFFSIYSNQIPETGPKLSSPQQSFLNFDPTESPQVSFVLNYPTPTLLPDVEICRRPPGFNNYIVNPSDSIYRISIIFNIDVRDLQQANCMGNNTVLLPGQILYVPSFAMNTPVNTSTPQPVKASATNTRRASTNIFLPEENDDEPDPPPLILPSSTPRTPSATPLRPTATLVTPSPTPLRPTPTLVTPSPTPPPPTATLATPSVTPLPPTTTNIPPTPSEELPTDTPIPPTATSLPPTSTSIPPTNTSIPPTQPPPQPTNTPVPSTSTPQPPIEPTATDISPTEVLPPEPDPTQV